MRFLCLLAILVAAPSVALPATIYVPDHYPRIQDAIDNASNRDTIVVRPGTYVENIDFLGKAIIVASELGPDVTVIDGGLPTNPEWGSVVLFRNGESRDAILEGFAVTNGSGMVEEYMFLGEVRGGGIYCEGASPTIRNNRITGNVLIYSGTQIQAKKEGGGIYCHGGAPLIRYNQITDNVSDQGAPYDIASGGGLFCSYSNAVVEHNLISNNTAFSNGGGLLSDYSLMTVSNNIIEGNVVKAAPDYFSGSGGGIHYEFSWYSGNFPPSITNNVIFKNSAGRGGGIGCLDWGTPPDGGEGGHRTPHVIYNNTIVMNSASLGGGALCCRQDTLWLINNILWNNTGIQGPEIYIGEGMMAPSSLTIDFCDVEGGKDLVHVGNGNTLLWKENMIDADPLFVDPSNGDYHLSKHSPCINMGENDGAPLNDPDGDSRPFMGTVDIGADEYTGTHLLAADAFSFDEDLGCTIHYILDAGVPNANRQYVIMGSLSGKVPGLPLPKGQTILPINIDLFSVIVMSNLNSAFFQGFLGNLDGQGMQGATLWLPPVPGAAGLTLHFAYALKGPPWDFASNPVDIEILD